MNCSKLINCFNETDYNIKLEQQKCILTINKSCMRNECITSYNHICIRIKIEFIYKFVKIRVYVFENVIFIFIKKKICFSSYFPKIQNLNFLIFTLRNKYRCFFDIIILPIMVND